MAKQRRVAIELNTNAGVALTKHISFGRTVELSGAILVPNVTSAEDASNYATITIDDGTTTIWQWSTQDSADGTLTAGQTYGVSPDVAALTNAKAFETGIGTGPARSRTADQTYRITVTHAGTGVAINANLVLIAKPEGDVS